MRPRPVCNKINEFLEEGLSQDAFLAIQPHTLVGPEKRQILGPAKVPMMMSPGGVSVDEFISILDDSTYSAVFFDGAIAIIQCAFDGDSLEEHRYSYIPCPVDPEILDSRPPEISLADWLRDMAGTSGASAFRSRGTYRFDCVRGATGQRAPHPISHLTFGSPDCRLPVVGPLAPERFFSFVFENFYRVYLPMWSAVAPHLRCSGTAKTITEAEARLHHLHWEESR